MRKTVLITGHKTGLGKLIYEKLNAIDGYWVFGIDPKDQNNDCFDVTDHDSVKEFAERFADLDILINCASINKLNWLEDVSPEEFSELMDVNVKGYFNTVKNFVSQLKKAQGVILNIVSNASHRPMTCSLAYNASKAAQHMMTLQLARELSPSGVTVFAISPNKLKNTGMSHTIDSRAAELRGWSLEEAKAYQLNSLINREELCPEALADFIVYLLSDKSRCRPFNGCVIPYGA